MMRLFTIGFTKKKTREFFGLLSDSGATALVDIRLRNRSQQREHVSKYERTGSPHEQSVSGQDRALVLWDPEREGSTPNRSRQQSAVARVAIDDGQRSAKKTERPRGEVTSGGHIPRCRDQN